MLLQPTARLFQLQGSRRSLEDWAAGLWRIMQRGLQPLRTGPLRRLRQFFAPPDIGHAQAVADVLGDGAMREQAVVLEDHSELAAMRRQA